MFVFLEGLQAEIFSDGSVFVDWFITRFIGATVGSNEIRLNDRSLLHHPPLTSTAVIDPPTPAVTTPPSSLTTTLLATNYMR